MHDHLIASPPISTPKTVDDIVYSWPDPAVPTFAADIGVAEGTVYVWMHRRAIPAKRFNRIVEKARGRHIRGVTHDLLYKLYDAAHRLAYRAIDPK